MREVRRGRTRDPRLSAQAWVIYPAGKFEKRSFDSSSIKGPDKGSHRRTRPGWVARSHRPVRDPSADPRPAACVAITVDSWIPAAVRVVKTSTNAHADAKAILKAMAGIGSPFGSRGFIGSGSGREKSWKTTSSRRLAGFSDRAGARSRRRAQFLEQPGARGLPVPVGGCRRDAERLAGFFERQTAKEPQLRELTLPRVEDRQTRQRCVEIEHVHVDRRGPRARRRRA